jgi:MFS-type transporter involved in bile tolerance (Atg22 family)
MVQFGTEICFLIVVIALALAFGLDDVGTAQLGQGVNTVWSSIAFWLGWRLLPHVPANHTLPEGRSLVTIGFVQTYQTAKNINQKYKHGLRWFLLAVVFSEAAVTAFTVVSVIYLNEELGMSGAEIGIFFVITLLGSIPGSVIGAKITNRLDPNRSYQLCMLCLVIWTVGGAIVVKFIPRALIYVWGVFLGSLLGWFYPTEILFFSMCLPEGQEAVSFGCQLCNT